MFCCNSANSSLTDIRKRSQPPRPGRFARRAVAYAAYAALIAGMACTYGARAQTACTPNATSDWMKTADALAPAVQPADCAIAQQSPPDFTWPDLGPDFSYRLDLTYPDSGVRSKQVAANWANWSEALPAGDYTWQVVATDKSGSRTSQARRFSVSASAVPFLLPDPDTLFNNVSRKAHPRGFPDENSLASMLAQRQQGLAVLLTEVDGKLANGLVAQPDNAGGSEDAAHTASTLLLNAAMAYMFTHDDKYFADASRRLIDLASWNPGGPTSYASRDQASNEIFFALALGYDWLGSRLADPDKAAVLANIQQRGNDLYQGAVVARPGSLASDPYVSHVAHGLNLLASASTLVAGDLPDAQNWMRDAIPLLAIYPSPWGGEDGAYANGTAQGTWDQGGSVVAWYAIAWAAGLDLRAKAWMRNYARWLAYFIPPGTPDGHFGDGAELKMSEEWARYGKGYTYYAPSQLGRWYAAQLGGELPDRIEMMLAPPADTGDSSLPAGTPNGALFQSIGWAAMHSDLSSTARNSVYFKSSPFGALNHSHADQNSFTLDAGGERLAIDSGYYDAYKSDHWGRWYKQTVAHNAITFDGGKGQVVDANDEAVNKASTGTVTRYVQREGYDIVSGDATQAYGSQLTTARRDLVYLRPGVILVHDTLASPIAHQWEWNIHALNTMTVSGDTSARIDSGSQSLCIDVVQAPPVSFTQTDRFTADPQGTGWAKQWHGAFYTKEASTSAEYFVLMRVGCTGSQRSARPSGDGMSIQIDQNVINFSASGISVSGPAASAGTAAAQ